MEDILSRLPDQILDRILCFLPQKEAVRTCVLSQSWRHLGSSRSKLELCHVTDFNRDRKKFLSVMYNTIRRYNHHHPLNQLSLKLSYATFRLDLPWITSEAPLLEELYLKNWSLRRILCDQKSRPVFNHLRKLSLVGCHITEEKFEVFLSSTTCPLLECLCIDHFSGFKNLNVGKARRLKHLEISHYYDLSSIPVDAPSTLETIRIEHCRDWRFLDNDNYFPRLNSLCLKNVGLKSETFNFFTSKYMPSLEKLELDRCYGCQEFQLSNSSIKYLSIIRLGRKPCRAAIIDAPNISYFKIEAYYPLPSLSFTPISSEWKSHVHLTTDVRNDRYDHSAPCLGIFHEIHRVLKSLSESQITLQLSLSKEYQHILDSTYYGGGLYKNEPLVVEDLSLELGDYLFSTVQSMFGYLFHVCRPRYIYNAHIKDMSKGVTARILWKLLLHQREKMGYFWNQDLVEVSMESSSNFMNPKDWQSVPGNSLSECDINQNIRFLLKWRGM